MSTDDHDPSVPSKSADDRLPADAPRTADEPTDAELMALAHHGASELEASDHDHIRDLWDGIAAAIAAEPRTGPPTSPAAAAEPTGTTTSSAPLAGVRASDTRPPDRAATRRPPRDRAEARRARRGSMVQSSEARQRRTVGAVLAGIAAVVLVVVGISWATTRTAPATPLATCRMDALDARAPGPVTCAVVPTEDGSAVRVDLASLPTAPDDAFYELWLLDVESEQLVSLGPVGPQDAYGVPAAVDLAEYPALDVSVEPADGDPTHSSDSILRGDFVMAGGSTG